MDKAQEYDLKVREAADAADEPRIYEIPNWNVSVLEGKIKKINKRANKIGCPELKIIDHGTTVRIHPVDAEANAMGKDWDNCRKITYHKISIEGEPPKVAGWTFLGTLDHVTIEGAVLVNTVPGNEIPTQFHNVEAYCDHCKKIRRRRDTFVLRNDNISPWGDQDYKVVGRNCLKDFLGHDPRFIASYLQLVRVLVEDLDDRDSDYYSGFKRDYIDFDLESSLTLTCAVIRAFGWVSRSIARDNPDIGPSTANTVVDVLLPPYSPGKSYKQMVQDVKDATTPEKDAAEAKKAIAWIQEQEATNEYMHNLKAIVNAGVMNFKTAGYACSIISTYQRSMDRLRQKEIEYAKRKNEWVGTEKKRQELTIEVIGLQIIQGGYGSVALHRMLDEEGRTVTWFSYGSKDKDLVVGKKYRIVGTVKKHDTYKDWKQTIINRVKVLEELDAG